jgi:hypothetical protein
MCEWFSSRSVKSVFRPSSFLRPRVFFSSRVAGPLLRTPLSGPLSTGPPSGTSTRDQPPGPSTFLPSPSQSSAGPPAVRVRTSSLELSAFVLRLRIPCFTGPPLHLFSGTPVPIAFRLLPVGLRLQTSGRSRPPAPVSFRLPQSGFTLSNPASPDLDPVSFSRPPPSRNPPSESQLSAFT